MMLRDGTISMKRPERYIVHIYRREGSGKAMRVAGLVEKVGNGSQRRFSSEAELWALLNKAPRRSRRIGGESGKAERKASE